MPERCLGYAGSGQLCCEALRFVSCRYPGAAAAPPSTPVLARRQLMSLPFLVHSQAQLLLWEQKDFSK